MAKGLGQIKVDAIKQGLKDRTRIKELEDMNLAQSNHIGQLEKTVEDWERKQRDGYVWVAIDPITNLITNAGTVLPNSRFTFTQEIDSVIDTGLYKTIPFYKLDSNGKMCIDSAQKIKYNTGGLL